MYLKSVICSSEDEARMKIYSVSTRHYFAFGALVSEELYYKLKGIGHYMKFLVWHLFMKVTSNDLFLNATNLLFSELPQVRWVLPDSYLDVRNKDYGGNDYVLPILLVHYNNLKCLLLTP